MELPSDFLSLGRGSVKFIWDNLPSLLGDPV